MKNFSEYVEEKTEDYLKEGSVRNAKKDRSFSSYIEEYVNEYFEEKELVND